MNKLLPILLIIALSGCASVKTVSFERFSESIPPLNQITEVSLGDTLVLLSDYKVGEALELKSDVKFTAFQGLAHGFGRNQFTISRGEKSYLFAELETEICYGRFKEESTGDFRWLLLCKKKGDDALFVRVCGQGLVSLCHSGLDDYQPDNTPKYQIIQMPTEDENNVKQEFIYNGKVDNSIKFIYREYIDDINRSPFTQNVQYDLDESDIIGFKELRIKIIEASNQTIKYKVITNFSRKSVQ